MKVAHPSSYLGLLPTELFPIIIDDIGLDLIAHFSFSKLHPRITTCYTRRGQAFWEPVCRASGLNCAAYVLATDGQWWEAAFQCAEHALACKHPA